MCVCVLAHYRQPDTSMPHADAMTLLLAQIDAIRVYQDTDLVFVASAVQKLGLAGVEAAKVVADPEALLDIDVERGAPAAGSPDMDGAKRGAAGGRRKLQRLPGHDVAEHLGGYVGAAGGPVRFTPRYWFMRINKPLRVKQRANFAGLKSTVRCRLLRAPLVWAVLTRW